MANVRTNENYRESWNLKNITNQKIPIGDLQLVPTLQPGKTTDLIKFYTIEKMWSNPS